MNNNLLGFGFMRLPLLDEEDRTVIDLDRVNEMVVLMRDMTISIQVTIIMGERAKRQSGNAL